MKNTKKTIKTRIAAGILSLVTIFSVGSAAVTNASAAELDPAQFGINAADEAFDALGDLVPGGKILLSPFKTLFHAGVDAPDPLDEINEKLDNMDNKLDQIDSKLDDLNANINKNTEWMGQKVQNVSDMSDLRADFKGLSPQASKLVKDIKAIETNKNLNNTQKIMRLAALTDTQRYDNVTTYVYNIKKSMDGSDPAYVDMYKALYTKYAQKRMFAREAYRDALPTAQALTTQYVYAAALMQECQVASKAVAKFTEKDVEALGAGYERRLYDGFDCYRHSMDDDDPAQALIAAANGAKNFKEKYDRPAYINKNANTAGKILYFGAKSTYVHEGSWNYTMDNCIDFKDLLNDISMTPAELNNLVNYVRANYPCRCFFDFCNLLGIGYDSADCYIIVDPTVTDTKVRNTAIDYKPTYHTARSGYDRTKSIKAVWMLDDNMRVETHNLYTFHSWDIETFVGNTTNIDVRDYKFAYRAYMTVRVVG